MERLSPVGLNHVMFADSALPLAYFRLWMKAASGEAANSLADGENDDVDGCGVQVEVATSDEELPPAEGGVA